MSIARYFLSSSDHQGSVYLRDVRAINYTNPTSWWFRELRYYFSLLADKPIDYPGVVFVESGDCISTHHSKLPIFQILVDHQGLNGLMKYYYAGTQFHYASFGINNSVVAQGLCDLVPTLKQRLRSLGECCFHFDIVLDIFTFN